MASRFLLTPITVALIAVPALVVAHDAFLLPDPALPQRQAACALRYHVSDVFPGEPVPFQVERAASLKLFPPDGDGRFLPLNRLQGDPPSPFIETQRRGTHAVLLQTTESFIELSADDFAGYLEHEGHDDILAAFRKSIAGEDAGDGDAMEKEGYRRWLKTIFAVKQPGGEAAVLPLGAPVEIVPDSDPTRLQPGDSLSVRALVNGQPREGLLISATRAGAVTEHDGYLFQARSDARGRVKIPIDGNGPWLVRFTVMAPAAPQTTVTHKVTGDDGIERKVESPVDWRSRWAALTFVVPEAAPTAADAGSDD